MFAHFDVSQYLLIVKVTNVRKTGTDGTNLSPD